MTRLRCLAFILLLPACLGATLESSRPSGEVLYRGDTRPPEEVRNAGGFAPLNANADDYAFGIYQHTHLPHVEDATQYVSTSEDIVVAALYAAARPKKSIEYDYVKPSWVYLIRPTPNFINARKTLGAYAVDYSHREVAALGGIRWEQVLGWIEVSASTYLDAQIVKWGPQRAAEEIHAELRSAEYVPNTNYNPSLDNSKASGEVPQLAGFPKGHPAWERKPWINFPVSESTTLKTYAVKFMEAHKKAVGWRGHFPLFRRLDVSEKALRKVVKASHAAVEAAADALKNEDTHTASLTAMSAEQEAAKARVWLKRLARAVDDHSFLALEGFSQAENYCLDARYAAAKSHWRGQTLMMKDYREQASSLILTIPRLASEPEERSESVREAQIMLKIITRIENQVRSGLSRHVQQISSLKNSLPPDPRPYALAEADLVWLKLRETQGDAICRELSALRTEQRGLKASVDEISLLAEEARQDLEAFLNLARQIDAVPQDSLPAEDQGAETESRSMVEIALEVVIEVISILPTPAAPALQVLKWGRRAWNALRIARRVSKISKVMNTPPQLDRLQKLAETSTRLEEMLKKPSLTKKPEGALVRGRASRRESGPPLAREAEHRCCRNRCSLPQKQGPSRCRGRCR